MIQLYKTFDKAVKKHDFNYAESIVRKIAVLSNHSYVDQLRILGSRAVRRENLESFEFIISLWSKEHEQRKDVKRH